jgi:hypothetical protein
MKPGETIDTSSLDPQDWITIWQSEMAALAVDRECHEAVLAGALAWKAIHDATAARDDGSAGRAGPDATPGAEAAGAASGAGGEPGGDHDLDGKFAELRRRLAELEHANAALRGG